MCIRDRYQLGYSRTTSMGCMGQQLCKPHTVAVCGAIPTLDLHDFNWFLQVPCNLGHNTSHNLWQFTMGIIVPYYYLVYALPLLLNEHSFLNNVEWMLHWQTNSFYPINESSMCTGIWDSPFTGDSLYSDPKHDGDSYSPRQASSDFFRLPNVSVF